MLAEEIAAERGMDQNNRDTLHCCKVSDGQTGEDTVVLSKQPVSSRDAGKDAYAGEFGVGVIRRFSQRLAADVRKVRSSKARRSGG